MSSYAIEKIEGIGAVFGAKLKAIGIDTTAELLTAALTEAGRKALAEKAGLTTHQVLEWANRADLMRIKGIGEEYGDLLESAGVDTVKELKNRVAANLHQKLEEVNAAKSLVRRLPTPADVADWIEQAKSLPATLTY
jgi:predicted flap endonuclease-1-like 5' DNA nuclease